MTMCGEFAHQGVDTLLLVPDKQDTPLRKLGEARDLFDFYSAAAPFEFKRFPNAFSLLSRFASLYSLALVLYTRARGYSLITTRALEVAVWAARVGVPVILESHNFSKFEKHRMIKKWVSITQQRHKPVSMVVTTVAGKNAYIRLGVSSERIRVLPNGVHIERFSRSEHKASLRGELGLPSDVPLLAFSGSLHEGRGGER